MSKPLIFAVLALALGVAFGAAPKAFAQHSFDGPYEGRNLDQIAFPIGGIGAGMFCVEGTGAISHLSIAHRPDVFNEPNVFAAVCVKGATPSENVARVLEGPVPDRKIFGRAGNALGSGERSYGLPRFADCRFEARFPFCRISLRDDSLPLTAEITGFSPFIPNEPDASSLPVGSLDYALTNVSDAPLDAVFSLHTRNFMGGDKFGEAPNGFTVVAKGGERVGEFAFAVQGDAPVSVDRCWFRGGWFDAFSLVWNNIQSGAVVDNPEVESGSPGASLYVPLTLNPGETKTVRILTAWRVGSSDLRLVRESRTPIRLAETPATGTAPRQQAVSGYDGERLVNTYFPDGDAHTGEIVSPEVSTDKRFLRFLVGGGSLETVGVAVERESEADGSFETLQVFRGRDAERLEPVVCDLGAGSKTIRIRIFDRDVADWGHINADSFVLTDAAPEPETDGSSTDSSILSDAVPLADFETGDYGDWRIVQTTDRVEPATADSSATYEPWAAARFASAKDALAAFDAEYSDLRRRSELFAETLDRSTLAPEFREAVEANLAILKSPTILRQKDGRLWGWEGCADSGGSCQGTCTHVWNYAQSIPHLFPSLERTFRQTEFDESLAPNGRQAFRSNLPISPGGVAWDASDGQLGTIMRLHRDWRISGSDAFLREYWPKVKSSLDYSIRAWDPNETGLLEESHHNTYDINYLGPDGHCGSFYLGALAAAIKMGEAVGDDVSRYREILGKGRVRYETELFNGEYFVQRVPTPGEDANPDAQSAYYRDVALRINAQGPKYQYGNGCLSDGVLGFWLAKVCGIDDDIVDPAKIRSHLLAVYKYNFKPDLSKHANPQRPTYALGKEGGLLLCSWPNGDKPLLPFVYSDEVWTGIEYQVASHLLFFGETEKASAIVRAARSRYDGVRRDPFDEYECGHWYARATSSFALLQGATGVRYDAVAKTLYYKKSDVDYVVPLFTETGWGVVRYSAATGEATVEPTEGEIAVETRIAR